MIVLDKVTLLGRSAFRYPYSTDISTFGFRDHLFGWICVVLSIQNSHWS